MTQSIITLTCLRCDGTSFGLSGGAASSVRKEVFQKVTTCICGKCSSENERDEFERKVGEYYILKSKGRSH